MCLSVLIAFDNIGFLHVVDEPLFGSHMRQSVISQHFTPSRHLSKPSLDRHGDRVREDSLLMRLMLVLKRI